MRVITEAEAWDSNTWPCSCGHHQCDHVAQCSRCKCPEYGTSWLHRLLDRLS